MLNKYHMSEEDVNCFSDSIFYLNGLLQFMHRLRMIFLWIDMHLEWRARDVLISKLYADIIISWFCGNIFH
jgi:hypothetical protein